MANFTLRTNPNSNACFTHCRAFQPPTSFVHQNPLNLFSSYTHLKIRLFSKFKNSENFFLEKRVFGNEVIRVRVDDDLDQVVPGSSQLGHFDDEENEKDEGFVWKWPPWKNLPQRYKLIGTTSLAFVICNMDKVNLSIAIIPMSHQFGWNSSMAGLVQSSFFWGYALSQLPGGWLAKIFGGRQVLAIGVLVWSLATACVPNLAGYMPGLVLSRILVGIGEGVSPAAATDLIARSIPVEERSRAVAFVFGGLSVGSVTGYGSLESSFLEIDINQFITVISIVLFTILNYYDMVTFRELHALFSCKQLVKEICS